MSNERNEQPPLSAADFRVCAVVHADAAAVPDVFAARLECGDLPGAVAAAGTAKGALGAIAIVRTNVPPTW